MIDFLNPLRRLNFVRFRYYFIAFSLTLLLVGVILYFVKGGFKRTIDFAGGTRLEVKILAQDSDIERVRKVLVGTGITKDVTYIGDPSENTFVINIGFQTDHEEKVNIVKEALKSNFGDIVIQREDTVGPKLSEEFFRSALLLSFVVALFLLLYIGVRFDFIFGFGAIIALIHDLLIMLTFAVFLDIPMDITIISAILTILGYSLTDTVVVYDRIRENLEGVKASELEMVVNRSIQQVIVRSILTSFTTLLVVVSLQIFGPESLKGFATLLTIGIISGTYSSLFIASPVVIELEKQKLLNKERSL